MFNTVTFFYYCSSYSASDNDTFNVTAATAATLVGAAGDDSFNVSANVGGTIDGGSGSETNGDLLNVSGHATSQLLDLGNSSLTVASVASEPFIPRFARSQN